MYWAIGIAKQEKNKTNYVWDLEGVPNPYPMLDRVNEIISEIGEMIAGNPEAAYHVLQDQILQDEGLCNYLRDLNTDEDKLEEVMSNLITYVAKK